MNMQELVSYAQQAGFQGDSAMIIAAIAMAESGGNPQATNSTGNSAGIDRGILQINSYYHSDVPDSCAFDVLCSFKQAYKISKSGTDFSQWCTAWSDGACGSKGGKYLGAGSPYQKFSPATLNTTPVNPPSIPNPLQGVNDFFNQIGGIAAWFSDPVRIFKLLTGIVLVAIALLMLALPGMEKRAEKGMDILKANPELVAA